LIVFLLLLKESNLLGAADGEKMGDPTKIRGKERVFKQQKEGMFP